PSDLVGGRAEAAKHVRDGHADDSDVEHLENGGEHYANNQRDRWPFIHFLSPKVVLVEARCGRVHSSANTPWLFRFSCTRHSLCHQRTSVRKVRMPCLAPWRTKCRRLSIAYSNTTKAKKRPLHQLLRPSG